MPQKTTSTGEFLMVYEYEEPTRFYPLENTATLRHVSEYERFEGDLENIRFPRLTSQEVQRVARKVWMEGID